VVEGCYGEGRGQCVVEKESGDRKGKEEEPYHEIDLLGEEDDNGPWSESDCASKRAIVVLRMTGMR